MSSVSERAASPRSASRRLFERLFALLFLAAGATHFLRPAGFVAIVPPYLPAPLLLVYLSGACELLLGGAVLLPRWQPLAAWGLVAYLVAVFPANVQMALHPGLHPAWTPFLRWARLPVQGLLIAWALSYTRRPKPPLSTRL